MTAAASRAAASQTRPRPKKPSRTSPMPGTNASGHTSLAYATFASRAPREASASTAMTRPLKPAYQPVEIKSTGMKLKESLLKLGVVTSQHAQPTHAPSPAPEAQSANPRDG